MGELVVVGKASIFELVGHDDIVIASFQQLGSVHCFLLLHVALTLRLDRVFWYSKPDDVIDGSAHRVRGRSLCALFIIMQPSDLIAQEPCSLASRMGDERLFLGEFQLEFFSQERLESLLDRFGF